MPRSQTPVVSRLLALVHTGLLPSGRCTPSALGSIARAYPWTTTIHFSGLILAACALASPLFRTPPLGDRTSVRLTTRRLTVGRVGLVDSHRCTHWVVLTSFKGCHPCSLVPGCSRHEQRLVRRRRSRINLVNNHTAPQHARLAVEVCPLHSLQSSD